MFRSLICFLRGKRIIEEGGYFIAQIYEIRAGWCGIDKLSRTWALKNNISDYCLTETFDQANDRLQNYLDQRKELSVPNKKTVYYTKSVPKFWRILRKNND